MCARDDDGEHCHFVMRMRLLMLLLFAVVVDQTVCVDCAFIVYDTITHRLSMTQLLLSAASNGGSVLRLMEVECFVLQSAMYT